MFAYLFIFVCAIIFTWWYQQTKDKVKLVEKELLEAQIALKLASEQEIEGRVEVDQTRATNKLLVTKNTSCTHVPSYWRLKKFPKSNPIIK